MHRSQDKDVEKFFSDFEKNWKKLEDSLRGLAKLGKPTVGEPDAGIRPGTRPAAFEPEEPRPQDPFPNARRDPYRHDQVPVPASALGLPATEPATAAQQRIMLRSAAKVLSSYLPRPEVDLEEMLREETRQQIRRGMDFMTALERAKQEVAARIRSGLA